MNGAKISKSTWNVAFVEEATEKWYTWEDIRCFFLQAHYRSFQDFTREWLGSAKTSRKNLIKKLAKTLTEEEVSDEAFGEYASGELYEKMAHMVADDLDTVQVLTMMHTHADKDTADSIDILLFDEKITKLGLRQGLMDSYAQQHVQAPAEIQTLAQQRLEAKQDKNYDLADQLREQISQLWWEVKDVNGGFELSQK